VERVIRMKVLLPTFPPKRRLRALLKLGLK
jgi:hypothetical protein